eukprot:6528325-Alexandrium_andersonii.AAC.1
MSVSVSVSASEWSPSPCSCVRAIISSPPISSATSVTRLIANMFSRALALQSLQALKHSKFEQCGMTALSHCLEASVQAFV